jgi:hypothetical protein
MNCNDERWKREKRNWKMKNIHLGIEKKLLLYYIIKVFAFKNWTVVVMIEQIIIIILFTALSWEFKNRKNPQDWKKYSKRIFFFVYEKYYVWAT